tara:strand:+ start:136 stop:753 length:618 start_codon:yes stop_codon:yes gene_type:complete
MNIKLPVNNVELVNKGLSNYWSKNKNTLQGYFYNKLHRVKCGYESAINNPYDKNLFEKYYSNGDVKNNKGKFRSSLRIDLGYDGLVIPLSKSNVGFELFSEKAYDAKINRELYKTVVDHILGVTDVGVDIFVEYKNTNWDVKYMCEEWLPNNLSNFLTCRILKGEHQKENDKDSNGIARGQHSLEQKMLLEHYKEVGIPTPLIVG